MGRLDTFTSGDDCSLRCPPVHRADLERQQRVVKPSLRIVTVEVADRLTHRSRGTRTAQSAHPRRRPAGPGWLHEMKHMPHGARASFALVSLREDATFVGGRYDNGNCPMVRRP